VEWDLPYWLLKSSQPPRSALQSGCNKREAAPVLGTKQTLRATSAECLLPEGQQTFSVQATMSPSDPKDMSGPGEGGLLGWEEPRFAHFSKGLAQNLDGGVQKQTRHYRGDYQIRPFRGSTPNR
jgi:hypothetical protein